jgi:hypothetical protein
MAQFKTSVITQKGLHLNTKIQAGQCTARFTKAAIGSGTWPEDADLSEATALIREQMSVAFNEVKIVDKDKVLLESAFPNTNVEEKFYISELGIFAEDPDEGEILYSISICSVGDADLMPSGDGGSVTMVYKSYITVWNAAEVTIATGGAFALAEDVGNKDELITIDKENLVRAINELAGAVSWIKENALFTSIYTSVVYDEASENLALAASCQYADESLMIPTSLAQYICDAEDLRFIDADELLNLIHGYVLPPATDSILGGLKVGKGLIYDDQGVVGVDPDIIEEGGNAILEGDSTYDPDSEDLSFSGSTSIPIATRGTLGVIKIGDGLDILPDGTVSVDDSAVLDEDTVSTDEEADEMIDNIFNN